MNIKKCDMYKKQERDYTMYKLEKYGTPILLKVIKQIIAIDKLKDERNSN